MKVLAQFLMFNLNADQMTAACHEALCTGYFAIEATQKCFESGINLAFPVCKDLFDMCGVLSFLQMKFLPQTINLYAC